MHDFEIQLARREDDKYNRHVASFAPTAAIRPLGKLSFTSWNTDSVSEDSNSNNIQKVVEKKRKEVRQKYRPKEVSEAIEQKFELSLYSAYHPERMAQIMTHESHPGLFEGEAVVSRSQQDGKIENSIESLEISVGEHSLSLSSLPIKHIVFQDMVDEVNISGSYIKTNHLHKFTILAGPLKGWILTFLTQEGYEIEEQRMIAQAEEEEKRLYEDSYKKYDDQERPQVEENQEIQNPQIHAQQSLPGRGANRADGFNHQNSQEEELNDAEEIEEEQFEGDEDEYTDLDEEEASDDESIIQQEGFDFS